MKITLVLLWFFVLGVMSICILVYLWWCPRTLCRVSEEGISCCGWEQRWIFLTHIEVQKFSASGRPMEFSYIPGQTYSYHRKRERTTFRTLSFYKNRKGYYWSHENKEGDRVETDTLPISFETGEWYLIRGLKLKGKYISYFFTVDSTGNLLPKYYLPPHRGSGPMGMNPEIQPCECG